ncbi:beta-1,4 N-acetylgalactosaminyltransferase 1-like [Saccoglossus kowalevskii]|uniref:Beta-1,4 N-acetylgalactosaminyltransferase 1-like n=1 Tax=Saccoglossus kowalevskii TaxID=10224 RepID=A0ABM0MP34_SACKO|nr:PREDICTED: beta-1,4 N-acetylgalactosaminyltransferase 1-like [Saccoglossus kowalevskii]
MNFSLKLCLTFLILVGTASMIISFAYLNLYVPTSIKRIVEAATKSDVISGKRLSFLEEHYRKTMSLDEAKCSCKEGGDADRIYFGSSLQEYGQRGSLDREEWEKKQEEEREPIVVCPSLSPLEYVGGGITVEPKKYVRLVGLNAHESLISSTIEGDIVITFTSLKEFGKIFIETPEYYKDFVSTENNVQKSATMRVKRDLTLINIMLKNVQYYSSYYDVNHRDVVEIKVLNFVLHVHVHIQRKNPPRLYDPGPDNHVSRKVTVITAIHNYVKVRTLLESVRKFYHNTTIIVADYTPPTETQKLNMSGVKQYFLPEKHNKFAAMSLAISQVRTKYFLYLGDDNVFTERTELELFVEKLDDTTERLDVVGGFFVDENGEIVDGDRLYMRFESATGGMDGDCMHLNYGSYRALVTFPQCVVVDAVGEFFMGKTLPWWDVSFDPNNLSLGLTSVFMEALGKLRIALCTDATVQNTAVYDTEDHVDSGVSVHSAAKDFMFKTNLHCFTI